MHVVFDHSQTETANIKTFWFRPDKPVRYIAGQFTELRLPHEKADTRGDKRWFTLSSSPTDELLGITTKISPEKSSTFKQQLLALQPGASVALTEPMGDFVLPKRVDTPLIFVAGGIGITPMHSIIKWLVDTKERRNIYLLYAVKKAQELAFTTLFESAPITYVPMLSEPEANWAGKIGRVTSDLILDLPHMTKNALVYISGPEPMVEQLNQELVASGLSPHRVIGDYFPGYPTP